ncbi:MAG: CRISPR-associated endonuclease Cas2 [Candidatus Jettenia sp.]|uniref:CRISPR-associated endoribonuclease Cas2 n=1 Tax=Candidatus Jettenia caeni TaxID=247490 RepID=I3IP80_9BACT|nr:CRISPR-associated endonuclease Cas2 [Candidatus Jettenia sp. AMX1]MBC6929759.1 CRISPR-associated endonuclease Cas2 [Candidatus Jettenia sp.]WKZ15980.1 MAG: CRISPR-associated endonuclease Cas2 [Candidatus Jettenia caeni]KAA0248703.1 MAG: CRISPR-associated endonuclease Cas2 [Candidatus Jettenia sp. AMX1]MCE7880676.1 CRISPR-associated endonuclease Cas2 [Candidatus Jettenia sp. AMX1]MCQ3927420.1 CRISPR-associated endonuclease Cas2 [Candidatus Jettenia sp.]
MYVIAVYDVDQKRCGKMLKLCRSYLHHIQNSVFEGEITEGKLEELKVSAKKIMNEDDEDSLILFKSRNEKWLDKEIVGSEKRSVDNIL